MLGKKQPQRVVVGIAAALALGFMARNTIRRLSHLANNSPRSIILKEWYGNGEVNGVVPLKSANDDRVYRFTVLDNKLEVLLVCDPSTEKASACIDVRIGSYADPEDLQGLAHFLEHMLHLGSAKYPSEETYKKYLSGHGGRSNASTTGEDTKYMFDVQPEYLAEALDIFANLFVAPLFTPSASNREVEAVHSEFMKKYHSDDRRLFHLSRHLAHPHHPLHKFSTGNLTTLRDDPKSRGVDVQEALKLFHRQHYSAGIMKMVVVGKESLDTLENMVRQACSGIPLTESTPLNWNAPLFPPPSHPNSPFGKLIEIVPVKDLRKLYMEWVLEITPESKVFQPQRIVSHLLGYEGKGSVLSYLKAMNWADSLSAGSTWSSSKESLFSVTVGLTQQGEKEIVNIVSAVYAYLALLKGSSQEDLKRIWEEQKQLDENHFRFKGKEKPYDYASTLAHKMHLYPATHVLTASHLAYHFDLELISRTLSKFHPENMLLSVISKQFKSTRTNHLVEPLYGVEYALRSLTAQEIEAISTPAANPALSLPPQNPFIPSNFQLKTPVPEEKTPVLPTIVCEDGMGVMWHSCDVTFERPKLNTHGRIISPVLFVSPSHTVLARLYCKVLNDALTEVLYDAQLAGLHFSITLDSTGIEVSAGGYNDKLALFLHTISTMIRDVKIDENRFFAAKDRYERRLRSKVTTSPPSTQADRLLHSVLTGTPRQWSLEEKLHALLPLTISDLNAYVESLWSGGMYVTCLAHGNILADEAKQIFHTFTRVLCKGAVPIGGWWFPDFRHLQLPPTTTHVAAIKGSNTEDANSALILYFHLGRYSHKLHALLKLFSHLAQQPCFYTLRTTEQLGYLVQSHGRDHVLFSTLGYSILIQSASHPPRHLHARAEAFLEGFEEKLATMSEDDFAQYRKAVVAKTVEKATTLKQQTQRFWSDIRIHSEDFKSAETVAAIVSTLTRQDIQSFHKAYITKAGERRVGVSVWVHGKEHQDSLPSKESLSTENIILIDGAPDKHRLEAWKRVLGVLPSGFGPHYPKL